MYIFTTLEFPTHYSDFHLLKTSVNAKYYYKYTAYFSTGGLLMPSVVVDIKKRQL